MTRTNDAPTGGYAEFLVAAAYGGTVAESVAEKSWDVELPRNGGRVQVKAYVDKKTGAGISFVTSHAYDLIVIKFDEDYNVMRATRVPSPVVKELCERKSRKPRGWKLTPTEVFKSGIDVTEKLVDVE